MIDSTGSRIPDDDLAHYRRLVGREAHVSGTLSMMAEWALDPLLAALPSITAQTLFITGGNDQTVPPSVAVRAAAQMPNARVTESSYGHLVHEEAPERVAELCSDFLA